MRPFTKITIIALFVLIAVVATIQLVIATRHRAPYPGPMPGTPLPTATSTP